MESINESTAEKVTLRNKIFDLVLNLNTLNNVRGDLAKLQDAAKKREEAARLTHKDEERKTAFRGPPPPGAALGGARFAAPQMQLLSLDDVVERGEQLDSLML